MALPSVSLENKYNNSDDADQQQLSRYHFDPKRDRSKRNEATTIVKIVLSCFVKVNGKQRNIWKTLSKLLVALAILVTVPAGLYVNYNNKSVSDRSDIELQMIDEIITSSSSSSSPSLILPVIKTTETTTTNAKQERSVLTTSATKKRHKRRRDSPQLSSSSSSTLMDQESKESNSEVRMLPIRTPFGLCWNFIAKVVCDTTILIEDEDINNNSGIIGIPIVANPESTMKLICKKGILIKNTTRFTVDSTGDRTVVLPICVQYYNNSFSIPIVMKTGRASSVNNSEPQIELLQSIESNKELQSLVSYPRSDHASNKVRVLPLKYVDFPSFYHGMNTDNMESIRWQWEKNRDDNFGNMVWRYASTMLLNPLSTHYSLNVGYDRVSVQVPPNGRPFDSNIIATANTLHLTKEPQLQDFVEDVTRRVREWNVPTVVVGIGIQFEFNDTNNNNFDMNTLDDTNQQQNYQNYNLSLYHKFQTEFLQEISNRQSIPAIGVRGDLTKSVCDNSGIRNCVSMGCPSLTISHNTNLGRTLQNNWNRITNLLKQKKSLRIAVTFPAYGGSDVVYTVVEMICLLVELYLEDTTNTTITLIQQDKKDTIRLEKYINDQWRTNHPQSKLNLTMVSKVEYYNVESWMYYAKANYDLCISSRIHGSMTFISSGIPTVAIPTDFRIMELLHSMKIPYILPTQLQPIISSWNGKSPKQQRYNKNQFILSILRQAANRNFTSFELNRRTKIQQWQSILQENGGIEINPALYKILQTPLE